MRPKVTLMPVREATITLKKQNKPVRLYKKTSERPCRVLEKISLDKRNQNDLVPGGWEN